MKPVCMGKRIVSSVLVVSLLLGGCEDKGESKQNKPHEQIPERPKTPIWGNNFHGLALSIEPKGRSSFKLGEQIGIMAVTKNFGDETVRLVSQTGPLYSFRVCLFDCEGRPVPLSTHGEGITSVIRDGLDLGSFSAEELKPGETFSEPVRVDRHLNITEEGIYTLVMMRQTESWRKGWLISNALKIKITKD